VPLSLRPEFRPTTLSTGLKAYGVAMLVIFSTLSVGIGVQSHLLAEHGGRFNWTIWNDVRAGDQPAHVPPMLFAIYLTWAVFLFRAAGDPERYASFLRFTLWANLFHGGLMVFQAGMDMDRYWSKFLTDIPFILGLSLLIYLRGPRVESDATVVGTDGASRSPRRVPVPGRSRMHSRETLRPRRSLRTRRS